jgi:fermentation-respiration switch protein FrsA (DUF1100 family)
MVFVPALSSRSNPVKKGEGFMDTIVIIILVMTILLLALGYYFATRVIYPRRFSVQKTIEIETEKGKLGDFDLWSKEEVHIPSPFGYDLFGYYLPLPGANKTIVISHGITYTLFGSVKYIPIFRKRGFNVLIYDLRNHGHNSHLNTTFGWYEKHDLQAVVQWAYNRLGADGVVGTMGESMGAGITLQHIPLEPRLAFAIADCPFSDLPLLLKTRIKADFHLPGFPLLNLANLWTRLICKFDINRVSPMRDIAQTLTPLLVLHGDLDTYVPTYMGIQLSQVARPGYSQLYLSPNAAHAEAFWTNPIEYDQAVGQFLARLGLAKE